MTTVVTIPARMSSIRLPRKMMLPINGEPVLWHTWKQVSKAKIDDVYICTTTHPNDDEIVKFCQEHNIKFVRGDFTDVISRLVIAANESHADIIVNVDGEQPKTDPYLIDKAVEIVQQGYPFVAFRGMGLGLTPIAMTSRYLKEVFATKNTNTDQEWWKLFDAEYHWCIDTQNDYDYIKSVMENE